VHEIETSIEWELIERLAGGSLSRSDSCLSIRALPAAEPYYRENCNLSVASHEVVYGRRASGPDLG